MLQCTQFKISVGATLEFRKFIVDWQHAYLNNGLLIQDPEVDDVVQIWTPQLDSHGNADFTGGFWNIGDDGYKDYPISPETAIKFGGRILGFDRYDVGYSEYYYYSYSFSYDDDGDGNLFTTYDDDVSTGYDMFSRTGGFEICLVDTWEKRGNMTFYFNSTHQPSSPITVSSEWAGDSLIYKQGSRIPKWSDTTWMSVYLAFGLCPVLFGQALLWATGASNPVFNLFGQCDHRGLKFSILKLCWQASCVAALGFGIYMTRVSLNPNSSGTALYVRYGVIAANAITWSMCIYWFFVAMGFSGEHRRYLMDEMFDRANVFTTRWKSPQDTVALIKKIQSACKKGDEAKEEYVALLKQYNMYVEQCQNVFIHLKKAAEDATDQSWKDAEEEKAVRAVVQKVCQIRCADGILNIGGRSCPGWGVYLLWARLTRAGTNAMKQAAAKKDEKNKQTAGKESENIAAGKEEAEEQTSEGPVSEEAEDAILSQRSLDHAIDFQDDGIDIPVRWEVGIEGLATKEPTDAAFQSFCGPPGGVGGFYWAH